MNAQCPECGKLFSRRSNLKRHMDTIHAENSSIEEEHQEEHEEESDDASESSDKESTDSVESENDGDDEEEEDDVEEEKEERSSIWQHIFEKAWTPKVKSLYLTKKGELEHKPNAGFLAYQYVLPVLRRNVTRVYEKKVEELDMLRNDPVHKKIKETIRRLQDEDDFEEKEALRYALDKRRFLIQDVTGTLSDDDLPEIYQGQEEDMEGEDSE